MNRFIFLFIFVLFIGAFVFNAAYADVFELKEGAGTFEGKVIKETDTQITLKLKTTGICTFPKALIKNVKKEAIPDSELYTKEDIYQEKAKNLDPKDAAAHLALAEWCLKNGTGKDSLSTMALENYRIAKSLDPAIDEKASKGLMDAENKEAGKSYVIAEAAFEAGDYLKSERLILLIMSGYPAADYANKAKELLVKIWGRDISTKVLQQKDTMPEVSISPEEVAMAIAQASGNDLKEKYFMKCVNKAMDFEERAKQVSKERAQGYYIYAIECYNPVFFSDDAKLKNLAQSKVQVLIKDFFKDTPVPASDLNYMNMSNYLAKLEDAGLAEKISGKYFKIGEDLYKKAKKSKQPEKAEKANSAYLCFSITSNFSKNEDLKQKAFNSMIDSQRVARALR